ncbi:hypothetical protein HY641_00720 [Candidatus Woesearchaeota archaeon]|nr:hypothetical protein [Candidatus Woesearchaeota archaeon]
MILSTRIGGKPPLFKRGQMVFFMLAAVIALLVLLYGLWTLTLHKTEPTTKAVPSQQALGDVQAVASFAEYCVQETLTDALINFGLVGGKVGYFTQVFPYDDKYVIPYYFITNGDLSPGRDLSPSKADVEQKILAKYVDANLQRCTDGFKNVKGLTVQELPPSSTVSIAAKDVSMKTRYPLTVMQGDKSTTLEEFSAKIPSRLSSMLDISKNLIRKAQEHEDIVYWDYLTDVTNMCEVIADPTPGADRCFNITAHAETDNTIIYRIVDPQSKVHFEPYFFQFAAKVRVK